MENGGNKKRERALNFSKEEVHLLVTLVLQNAHIIESKKNDAVTWKAKSAMWERIAIQFNATSGSTYRNSKVLRLKYDVLKRDLKKMNYNKLQQFKTGGGTAELKSLTAHEEQLSKILSLSIKGLPSRFDSDAGEVESSEVFGMFISNKLLSKYCVYIV